MGITSSTDLKPGNSDPKSQKNQVQPEKVGDSSSLWQDRLQVFMKEGACNETYTAFKDCVEEAEKKNKEPISLCYPMLEKCMERHSDYYHPFLDAKKTAVKLLMKDFVPSTVWRDPGESVSPNELKEEEEREEVFLAFMRGGGCKEPFTAWEDCYDEANKNKEDMVLKCVGVFSMMTKCMDAHPDYYRPFLAAKKTAEEHMEKELQAFLKRI
ncbi:GCK domain [Arabidopsis suecica]|uniref:GCK domain n=1 Tax=Arabidopsis suecica TaxID=45249 RepID=A0A8T2H3B7_ARASU|nr:GCK domain [Arabidopsis suecica]